MRVLNLDGKSFGRLTVIERVGSNEHGQALWRCKCSCGGEAITTSGKLNGGHTQSCGCIKVERIKKMRPTKRPLGMCAVDGCNSLCRSPGSQYCGKHDARARRNGSAELTRRENGLGSVGANGYIDKHVDGRRVYEHVLVAEKALGKKLPKGAVVHHINKNRTDNRPSNLVICPNQAYHALIHKRARSLGYE